MLRIIVNPFLGWSLVQIGNICHISTIHLSPRRNSSVLAFDASIKA